MISRPFSFFCAQMALSHTHKGSCVRAGRWNKGRRCSAVLGYILYIGKWCRPHAPPTEPIAASAHRSRRFHSSTFHLDFASVSPRFHIDSPRFHLGFTSVSHRLTSVPPRFHLGFTSAHIGFISVSHLFTVRSAFSHRYSDVDPHFPKFRSPRSLWSL